MLLITLKKGVGIIDLNDIKWILNVKRGKSIAGQI